MELVGRRAERAVVERAFQRAALGRRTVVSIRGEAGIGKSALLGEVRSIARSAGGSVVSTSVTEAEAGIGWGGLATLLHGLNPTLVDGRHPTHVAALSAVMGAGDTATLDPLTAAAALTEVLRELTADAPAVVAIDDLHWLDPASAGAFSFALRLLADRPLLFVATSRPVRLPLELDRVVETDDLVVVEPSPLSVAGVRELLIDRYDTQLGRADLVHLHTVTGGNPLHVVETGRLLQTGVPLADALLPASLRDIIDVDLRRVDTSHLPVLAAAALMPQPRLSQLRELFDDVAVDAAISAAEAIDVVRITDDAVAFRHPLLIAGLAERLTTTERRALHRRCAELAGNDEVRAFHVSRAAVGADPAAADLLDAAADAATDRGLYANALAHAERALVLTDPEDHAALRRRTIRVADVAIDCGEPRRALALLRPLVDQPEVEDPQAAKILRLAATAISRVHGVAAAIPMLEVVTEMYPVGSVERANAIGQLSAGLMPLDIDRAAAVCADAERAALEAGDVLLAEIAVATRAVADTLAGRQANRWDGDFATLLNMSVLEDRLAVAVWCDDHVLAEQLYQEGLRRLAARPTVTGEHNLLNQAADLRARQGRLEEAAQFAERALTLSDDVENGGARSADYAVVAATRGEIEIARRHAAFATGVAETLPIALPPVLLGQTHFGAGYTEAIAGNVRGAVTHLRSAALAWDSCGLFALGALPVRTNLVEVLLHAGEVQEAEVMVQRMVEVAEVAGLARGHAEVAYVRGQLLAARGLLDEAALQVDTAVEAYEALDLPILRARALLVSGNIARRRRQRARSRQLLEEALAGFLACGALGFVPRVHAELARLGDRGVPDQLTATESQIASLVAAGRTNDEVAAALFISRRTVESNLTRIYRKLDVRSRSELAARMSSR